MTLSFQSVQAIGPAGDSLPGFPEGRNRLIYGDSLPILRAWPAESVDVFYLDPPFFTGKRRHVSHATPDALPSYADAWDTMADYLAWLGDRLAEMRRALKPEGALLLHLDWHAVHYAKVLLDGLFGAAHFQNEFIWYYSGGGASTRRFARKHDSILFYTKSKTRWKFHADRVRTPYKWTDGQPRADGSERDYTRGKLPDDVWEAHALLPWAEESLGYPTQKPEALLERLLLPLTDPGDVVGDVCCGCGTTAAVAQRLGCRWMTVDNARPAVCLAAERLAAQLVPGCLSFTATRARARAHERYARILADDARLGLDAATLATCQHTLLPPPGFAVERAI